MATTFNITVYFDTICPWCYIGDRALQEAIALYQKTYPGGSKDTFRFTFLPYYLNAALPREGIPTSEQIARKNGDERVNAIQTRLRRVGRAHGIDFTFRGKVGNTRDSHRLIRYAGATHPEAQKALIDCIFSLLFESDMDVTSHADLAKAAAAVGMPADQAIAFLRGEDGGDEVDALAAEARADGVSAVPTVEIDGTRVEGAEDASAFYEAFVNAKTAAWGEQ